MGKGHRSIFKKPGEKHFSPGELQNHFQILEGKLSESLQRKTYRCPMGGPKREAEAQPSGDPEQKPYQKIRIVVGDSLLSGTDT